MIGDQQPAWRRGSLESEHIMDTYLAGDIGGTKSLLGLFTAEGGPRDPVRAASVATSSYTSAEALVGEFLDGQAVDGGMLAIAGPVLAAGLTGEWRYLPAGICVGVAGLLAGSGAAVVQSAMVPIAMPETDNPFASGETGKGVVAALLLMSVLTVLAIATIPIALALFWASDRGRVDLVTGFAVVTVLVGWSLARLGRRLAVFRISRREPEFLAAVTPAR